MKVKFFTLLFTGALLRAQDKAIVLFDFLSRFNQEGKQVFEDDSEGLVLSELECLLEEKLVEPFDKNYSTILEEPRQTIREWYSKD